MSIIECSTTFEAQELDLQDFLEELSFTPVKDLTQDLTILILPEDQLNDIPSSTLEIQHLGSNYHIKVKGRLQKRDGPVEARAISLSTVLSSPVEFFKLFGYVLKENRKRDVVLGNYDGISVTGYFGEKSIIEGSLTCQLSEIEECIVKLKEFRNTVSDMIGGN